MATLLTMPKLGMTMEEGTVHAWFKREGEPVEEGEPLLSVLTDKIDIEVDAPAAGVLRKILVQPGETVPINTPIAIIAAADADISPLLSESGRSGDGVAGRPASEARNAGLDMESAAHAATSGTSPAPAAAAAGSRDWVLQVRATPVARRIAREHGIDVAAVAGTGPRGRVTRADVEEYLAARQGRMPAAPRGLEPLPKRPLQPLPERSAVQRLPSPPERWAHPGHPPGPGGRLPAVQRRTPLAGRRGVIARRMTESAFSAPHVTLMTEADVTELVRLRAILNEAERGRGGDGVSYLDLFIVMAARALVQHPYMNARLDGDDIVVESAVHIGVAVALTDGLLVPVVRDAAGLSVGAVARRRAALVDGARAGTLTPDQLAGGTFTITNLGAYEIDGFTPIINPPQAAILGTGRIVEKPAVYRGEVAVRSMMTLSLSFDHRLVDGAPAAAFLQSIKRMAEEPALLHL